MPQKAISIKISTPWKQSYNSQMLDKTQQFFDNDIIKFLIINTQFPFVTFFLQKLSDDLPMKLMNK